jgi:glucose-fructose oxidoreductase
MTTQRKSLVRYAVIGQGYISQIAVLPAFRHARHSELVALVSDDPVKLRKLGKKYGVAALYPYEQLEECIEAHQIDAVYLAVPNHLHRAYAERAARAGAHVLCEKPMAVSEEDCRAMIETARACGVQLMISYRLHFEPANLAAIDVLRRRKIGEPRLFSSTFTMPVKEDNIRRGTRKQGGGPVYDIGIYCINAARYLFRSEPVRVSAVALHGGLSVSVSLEFPGDRLAQFVCSFAASSTQDLRVVGTQGDLLLEDAYSFTGEKRLRVTVDGKSRVHKYAGGDQFGPVIDYFAECVRKNRKPEPSGLEGLADVRIIEAIFRSVDTGKAVDLPASEAPSLTRPQPSQKETRPAVRKPELIRAEEPEKKEAA